MKVGRGKNRNEKGSLGVAMLFALAKTQGGSFGEVEKKRRVCEQHAPWGDKRGEDPGGIDKHF